LKNRKYRINKRYKKLQVNDKDYEVISYVTRKGAEPSITIIMDIVSPRRPYPVFVYIFAVAIYVLVPKMSQRRASEITRRRFGLTTFSASTLCRAKKLLAGKAADLVTLFDKNTGETPWNDDCTSAVLRAIEGHNDECISGAAHDAPQTEGQDNPTIRPSLKEVFRIPFLKGFVTRLINRMPTRLERSRFERFVGWCCRKYYLLYRSLII